MTCDFRRVDDDDERVSTVLSFEFCEGDAYIADATLEFQHDVAAVPKAVNASRIGRSRCRE